MCFKQELLNYSFKFCRVELSLYAWNKIYSIMMFYYFKALLDSLCQHFILNFVHIYTSNWYAILFILFLSDFDIGGEFTYFIISQRGQFNFIKFYVLSSAFCFINGSFFFTSLILPPVLSWFILMLLVSQRFQNEIWSLK